VPRVHDWTAGQRIHKGGKLQPGENTDEVRKEAHKIWTVESSILVLRLRRVSRGRRNEKGVYREESEHFCQICSQSVGTRKEKKQKEGKHNEFGEMGGRWSQNARTERTWKDVRYDGAAWVRRLGKF